MYICSPFAGVVELVDTPDLGSGAARRGGSSPFTRTKKQKVFLSAFFIFHPFSFHFQTTFLRNFPPIISSFLEIFYFICLFFNHLQSLFSVIFSTHIDENQLYLSLFYLESV